MTLTVPSFQFYWISKCWKGEEETLSFNSFVLRFVCLLSVHPLQFINYINRGLKIFQIFLHPVILNNFAVDWIPHSPWHLSIHSLAAGFAFRVNKGGNLINIWRQIWLWVSFILGLSNKNIFLHLDLKWLVSEDTLSNLISQIYILEDTAFAT